MAAFPYWRLELTYSATQIVVSHIEMMATTYGPTVMGGAVLHSATGSNPSYVLNDNEVLTIGWTVSGGGASIAFQLPSAREVKTVAIWPSNGSGHPNSVRAFGSVDGVVWSEQWFDDALVPSAGRYNPVLANSPDAQYAPETTPLVYRYVTPEYDLDAAVAFRDSSGTPVSDGDDVYSLANNTGYVGAATQAIQSMAVNRPKWRASGILGLPYVEMDGNKWFEPVPWTQPGGFDSWRRWSIFAVVDGADVTGTNHGLWGGNIANVNGGKGGAFLIPATASTTGFRMLQNNRAVNAYTPATRVISGAPATIGVVWGGIDGVIESNASGNTNLFSSGINEGIPFNISNTFSNGFRGHAYRLITCEGSNQTDNWLVSRWLMGKYVYGFIPAPPSSGRRRMPYIVN